MGVSYGRKTVNSTLDWSPLKWTNELKQIWNLSLSQRTLILDTIGEDTIKTVLSWVVITRIVIAHIYTLTYVTNIYPIITWSRPNLLLPWLILSFFKNVVLEVIVIAIGLLLWYDRRFSIPVFLEFILVKLVPLILASYNWYSNSCLFMHLRHMDKMRSLRRAMRSDSNFITSRLCAKLEDSKYRTRSLTTLLSCESYETYDTQDTISRILEDVNLTPVQKTMRILRLTDEDVAEARARIKKRVAHKKLTEKSDECFEENDGIDLTLYYSMDSDYEKEINSMLRTKDEVFGGDSISSEAVSSRTKSPSPGEPQNVEEMRLEGKKREGTDQVDTNRMKQMKLGPSSDQNDTQPSAQIARRKDTPIFCCGRQSRRSVEKSCSPVKLQALFNCDCLSTDYSFTEAQDCCVMIDATLRTSTPRVKSDSEKSVVDTEAPYNNLQSTIARPYTYTCSVTNVTTDFARSGCTLMDTLLKNNLEILKSLKKKDRSAEHSLLAGDTLARDLELLRPEENERLTCGDLSSRHRDARADAQDLADFVKDLTITRNVMVSLESLKIEEGEDDPEEKAEMELLQAVVAVKSSAEDCVSSVEDSNTQLYIPRDAEKNASKPDLPEYSFGDTSIPRFYKDSMEMFDGCYEKDFDNNAELQCLLHQMEKKKWNLFAGQTNLETLLATAFSKREGQIDEGLQSWSSDASEKTDRFETATSTSSGATLTNENLVSQKVQADEDHRQHTRPKPRSIPKPSILRPTKDACTQKDDVFQPTRSFSSLTKAKKRQYARKRKYFVDKSGSISQTSSGKIPVTKTESSSSVPKDHPRSQTTQLHRNISKSSNRGTQKQGDLTRSASEKSVCECKMQKLESKYCASSEFRLDKKEVAQRTTARAKIDSFGTVTLSQVARVSEVPNVLSRRKPPVYPKKTKKENPASPVAKKLPSRAQQDLMEPKQSMDKQSYSSKMFQSKNRVQSVEEQEAREMRALKVYNELTLLKDKKELEARKKLLAGRNPVNRVADDPNRYSRSRKANLTRSEKAALGNAATLGEGCVDKENMCVDARSETDSSAASSSRETKLSGNTTGLRSFHVPNDRHDCSKLLSVNKVTEILLDNFDRLHGSQGKQDAKKGKVAADVDNRKQYKRYRKPKALIDEENVSASSSKKLEGAQKGRELERTPAKEDVRKKYTTPGRSYRLPRREVRRDATSPEAKEKELLTTIMLKMDQSMVSSWSSSVIDEGNEIQAAFQENTTTQGQIQPLIDTEEREATRGPGTLDTPSVPPSSPVESPKETETATRIEEDANQRGGASQSDGTGASRRPDPVHFTRNINVSSLAHGVVLANINAQGKSRQRDILDDRTERLLHNAFSYKSMDSLLDVPPDVLNVEDMLNDNSLESPVDEFVCRSSNDAVDVLTDHLPVVSYQGGSLEQTILTTIRNSQEDSWLEGQSEGTCDLCIITIDNDNSAVDFEEGAEETFEALERRHRPGADEMEMNEVLASITEALRNMNIGSLDLSAIGNLTFEIPRDFASDGYAEARIGPLEVDEAEDRVDEVEDRDQSSKKEEELLKFLDDGIFTNIQFPIVIQRSDLVPDVLITSNDDPQPLDTTVGRLLRMNMLTLIEKKEEQDGGGEKMDEADVEEVFQGVFDVQMNNLLKIEQLMFATVPEHLSRVPSEHPVDVDSGVEYLEEEKLSADLGQESVCSIHDSSVNLSNDTVLSSVADSLESYLNSSANDPSFAQEDLNKGSAREGINKTFDVVKDESLCEDEVFRVFEVEESIKDEEAVDEVINIGESIKVEEIDVEESVEAEDISTKSSVEIEEIKVEDSFEADYIKTEIIFKLEDTTTEESIISKEIKTEESIIIEEIKTEESFIYGDMQFNELKYEEEKAGDLNEGEVSHTIGEVKEVAEYRSLNTETKHQEIVGVDPQVSLKVVVVFWFVVFFFYIQYFYHKIFSFSQISRATSTFRPFEVHTVSTSTSVLLEKTKLVQKIRDEIVPEDDEGDSSEKSIELGEIGATHLTEGHLRRNLVSSGADMSSNIIEFENEDDIDELTRELEELMMNFNEQAAETSLLSKFDKEASTQLNILDSFTIESQKEGESIPVSLPDGGYSQPQFPLPESQGVALKSVDNLQEITKKRSSILEEQKLLELHRGGETKTFQFEEDEDDSSSSKSLLEDDHQRSRESQLNVTGKVKIDEEGPGTEEVVRSGEKVETDALVADGKEESTEEDAPVPNEETSVHEETVSTEGNIEGSRTSVEVTEAISPGLFETSVVEIDSFDSTYTRLSETSKNGAYTVDLNDSSMEEFPVISNRSNEAT